MEIKLLVKLINIIVCYLSIFILYYYCYYYYHCGIVIIIIVIIIVVVIIIIIIIIAESSTNANYELILFSLRTLQPDGGTEKVSKYEEIM